MTEIVIICAGVRGMKEDYFKKAEAEYLKRISGYAKISVAEVGQSDEEIIAAAEKKKRFYKIALSPEGGKMNSEEFAGMLSQTAVRGYPGIVFIIGGSDGFGDSVRKYADKVLSFSDMTFPHRLMRIILEEQIFRGYNILSGGKYNK